MSYDISLYAESFLRRAVATNLGDWTEADPIPPAAVNSVIEAAEGEGFVAVPESPEFAAFLRGRGSEPPIDFRLDTAAALAELHIHRGEIAFTIPHSERAEALIELCTRLAKRVAAQHGLGFWDPQVGTLDGEEDDTPMWLETLRSGDAKMREEAAVQLAGRDPRMVAGPLATAARSDVLEDG